MSNENIIKNQSETGVTVLQDIAHYLLGKTYEELVEINDEFINTIAYIADWHLHYFDVLRLIEVLQIWHKAVNLYEF